jgi:hypothetical protein
MLYIRLFKKICVAVLGNLICFINFKWVSINSLLHDLCTFHTIRSIRRSIKTVNRLVIGISIQNILKRCE